MSSRPTPEEAVAENMRERARKPANHYAKRPCPDCGFVRTVYVHYWREPDGSYRESRPSRCGVCEALARARHYDRCAAKARRRANELFARRGKALQRRLGPPRKEKGA